MTLFEEAIEYVVEKVIEAIDEEEYPESYDTSDVIHTELDYYCSHMYESNASDIIVSYGLTKALQEYDNQGFSDCPKTSFSLLYVIMRQPVEERLCDRIKKYM